MTRRRTLTGEIFLLRQRYQNTPCKNVAPHQCHWNTFFLDWRWILPAFLENPHQQLALEVVVLKTVPLGCCDILPNSNPCNGQVLHRCEAAPYAARRRKTKKRGRTYRGLEAVVLCWYLGRCLPVSPLLARLAGRHLLLLHLVLLHRNRLWGHRGHFGVVDGGCCHRMKVILVLPAAIGPRDKCASVRGRGRGLFR